MRYILRPEVSSPPGSGAHTQTHTHTTDGYCNLETKSVKRKEKEEKRALNMFKYVLLLSKWVKILSKHICKFKGVQAGYVELLKILK